MRLEVDSSHFIDFNYKINEDYLVDFNINMIGMNEVIPRELNFMNLEWQMKTPQTEKSKENQDMYTGIYYQYFADKDDIDYLGYTNSDDVEKISNKLSWVAFQQQFFSSILVAKNGFKNVNLTSLIDENSDYVKNLSAEYEIEYIHDPYEKIAFEFYSRNKYFKILTLSNRSVQWLRFKIRFIWESLSYWLVSVLEWL